MTSKSKPTEASEAAITSEMIWAGADAYQGLYSSSTYYLVAEIYKAMQRAAGQDTHQIRHRVREKTTPSRSSRGRQS